MQIFNKLKNKEEIRAQLYSFVKTYLTVFLAILLYADQQNIEVFNFAFLLEATKASFIAVLRNFYKLLTEK